MRCDKPVLVVEDDPDLLENIKDLLEGEGYPVLGAGNGRVALDLLRSLGSEQLPGCIILDLMMPVMDGKTFLETLHREHPEDLAKIAVVVATAKVFSAEQQDELPPGVRYLRKPLDVDKLLSIVADHCGIPRAE